eukprot:TRINITY_DN2732_c0_g1_i3.p1 TRINITY_DN2732_c0_g1~~TRINITY_DN2732_c0_g1_i3.p1  ORF type:complete len:255 (+),score=101.70 TRINITY_DN2732_c0_g1_i3:1834-2598(+)
MLAQLRDDSSELYPSDGEDVEEAESEEDISYYAEGDHNDAGIEKSVAEDLMKEFALNKEDALQQSITEKESEEIMEEKTSQLMLPDDPNNPAEGRIPSAMRARPKIPRTPIPNQKLEQVRKENQEILRNAVHVQKNPQSNKKKPVERVKEEERFVQENVRKKMIRSEAKSRTIEEIKFGKEGQVKKKEEGVKREGAGEVKGTPRKSVAEEKRKEKLFPAIEAKGVKGHSVQQTSKARPMTKNAPRTVKSTKKKP